MVPLTKIFGNSYGKNVYKTIGYSREENPL
jgi:hypothetical protein